MNARYRGADIVCTILAAGAFIAAIVGWSPVALIVSVQLFTLSEVYALRAKEDR